MAHGNGPRADRPHQRNRMFGQQRRRALEFAQNTRVKFADGVATESDVKDAERWAAAMDRATYRVGKEADL